MINFRILNSLALQYRVTWLARFSRYKLYVMPCLWVGMKAIMYIIRVFWIFHILFSESEKKFRHFSQFLASELKYTDRYQKWSEKMKKWKVSFTISLLTLLIDANSSYIALLNLPQIRKTKHSSHSFSHSGIDFSCTSHPSSTTTCNNIDWFDLSSLDTVWISKQSVKKLIHSNFVRT